MSCLSSKHELLQVADHIIAHYYQRVPFVRNHPQAIDLDMLVMELMGGTPQMCLQAAAMAISNLLGLVCDPVAGLVEVPCQSRNAVGAVNAVTCAEITLSGVVYPIPFDEMVDAMYKVGKSIPFELRETAIGGCAGTPTGCGMRCRI